MTLGKRLVPCYTLTIEGTDFCLLFNDTSPTLIEVPATGKRSINNSCTKKYFYLGIFPGSLSSQPQDPEDFSPGKARDQEPRIRWRPKPQQGALPMLRKLMIGSEVMMNRYSVQ